MTMCSTTILELSAGMRVLLPKISQNKNKIKQIYVLYINLYVIFLIFYLFIL